MKNSLILLTGFILVGISMSHIIPSENQGEEGEEALNSGKNKDELVFANVVSICTNCCHTIIEFRKLSFLFKN